MAKYVCDVCGWVYDEEVGDADLGIAGGQGSCLIFKKGEPYKKVSAEDAEKEFFKEIRALLDGE